MRLSSSIGRPSRMLCSALLLVSLLATAVAAQVPNDVRAELERTREVLDRGREIVPASNNAQAIELLHAAERTQAAAIDQFQAGHARIALDMTLEARRMAFHAIDLARGRGGPGPGPGPGPIDLEPRAQHAIEVAGDHVERARECVGTPIPPVAQRILDLAAARLDEARQAFRERRFSLALDIATQVDRMLGDVCRGNRGEDLDRLYDNVEQLIERAAPIITAANNPTALGMLEQAHNLVQRGREAMAANNTVLARESLRTARDLLLQALRLADHLPDASNVDRLLEDTANDLAKLGEQIQAAGHPEATVLFERALEHLERARNLRSRDDLRPTLAELRVARNLAWRAARLAGVRGF